MHINDEWHNKYCDIISNVNISLVLSMILSSSYSQTWLNNLESFLLLFSCVVICDYECICCRQPCSAKWWQQIQHQGHLGLWKHCSLLSWAGIRQTSLQYELWEDETKVETKRGRYLDTLLDLECLNPYFRS